MKSWIIACRTLAQRPAFAVSAALTLALGIGATTAIFSVVDTVLVKPLPFPNADQLVTVTDTGGAEPERLAGRRVAPRYFAVFGMSALLGRTFTPEEERFGGPPVAVLSEGLWTRRYIRLRLGPLVAGS
jgi:hypothetical protein